MLCQWTGKERMRGNGMGDGSPAVATSWLQQQKLDHSVGTSQQSSINLQWSSMPHL